MSEVKKSYKKNLTARPLLQNRKATYNYEKIEAFEAGIVLTGDEVKSLRQGQGSLAEAYAALTENRAVLFGLFIPPYKSAADPKKHDGRKPRTLLIHKREIRKLHGATRRQGLTLIPTQLYTNPRGMIKLEIILAKGKTTVDKRETLKQRAWQRQKQRLTKSDASCV